MGDNMKKYAAEIPVMHCFDNNYVIPAAVSFYSMLEHANQSYFYRLFVLHSDITIQNQKKLEPFIYLENICLQAGCNRLLIEGKLSTFNTTKAIDFQI